jgi:hypothetical protein
MKISWNGLMNLVDADFDCVTGDCLGSRIDNVLDQACINADDTMKEGTHQTWDAIAIATIESILAYSNDTEVQNWFKNNGISY